MDPLALLSLCACIWTLFHFWIAPLLQSGWQAKDLRQKIAKAGVLAASEKVRDVAGAALIALVFVVSSIFLLDIAAGLDQALGQSVISALSSLHESVSAFAKGYGTLTIWVGIIGSGFALYLVARSARSRVVTVWTARTQDVVERLGADPGLLADYADDTELLPLIQRTGALISHLEEIGETEEFLQKREEAGAELSELFYLCAMEIARKELDLEQVLTIQETDDTADEPNILVRVISSKEFAADLDLVNRPLSMLVTGLLIVSLIGWTSQPLANSMRLAVNNLRINSLSSDVEREIQTAVEKAKLHEEELEDDGDANLDSAERIALASRQIARVALEQMMRSGVLERSAGVSATRRSQAEFVRAAILQQEIEFESTGNRTDRLRAATRESVGREFLEPQDVLRQIEQNIKPKVEALESRDPRLLTQLRQRINGRYGAPMGALDAQGNLIARMVEQSFSSVGSDTTNELYKKGADFAREIGEKAVGKWATSQANSLVVEALVGQARAEVAANLRAFRFELTPESQNLVNEISSATGRGWTPPAAEVADQAIARRVAQNVASYSSAAERAAIVRNLGGYSEIFPSLAQGLGEGLAQLASQSAPKPSIATNFRRASRSFRVRGVLFGQDLDGDDLDVTALTWKLLGDRQLSLVIENNGQQHELGAFDAGILNQALRYAADQRVVATTITPGDGKVVARVTYLHPVLADTPLGCRIVESDRFVDTFTLDRDDSRIDPRLKDVSDDRMAIQRWLALANIAETLTYNKGDCPTDQIQEFVGEGAVVTNELAHRLRSFMSDKLGSDASTNLIEGTLDCAADNPLNVGQCLCGAFSAHRLAKRYWFPEDHTSQFRESEARLDPEFEFVLPTGDSLGHFDFWIHSTFAVRNRDDGVADESTAEALDFTADQLHRVNSILKNEKIPGYLLDQLNMSASEFLEPIEQFLVIQRLVRAAFNGELGEKFPLAQLIELERDSRPFVEYQPTIRWEPVDPESPEFFDALRDAGEDAFAQITDYYRDQFRREANGLPRCGPTDSE